MDSSRLSSRHSQTAQVNNLKHQKAKLKREIQYLKKIDTAKTKIAEKEERSKTRLESKVRSLKSQLKQKNEIINSLQSRLQDSFNENKSDGATHAKKKDTPRAKVASTERLQKEINTKAQFTKSLNVDIQNLQEKLAQTIDEKKNLMKNYGNFVREQKIKQNIVSKVVTGLVDDFNCLRNEFSAFKRNIYYDLDYFSTELKINLLCKIEIAIKKYQHHSDSLAHVAVEKPAEKFCRLQAFSRNASKKDEKTTYRHGKTSTVAGRIEGTVAKNEEMRYKIEELETSLLVARKALAILKLRLEEREAVCSRRNEEIEVQRQELDRLDRANSMQSKLIEEHMQSERQLHAHIAEITFQLTQNKNNNVSLSQTPTSSELPLRTNQLNISLLKETTLIAKDKLKLNEADFDGM